jgi:hypothetical protein
MDVDPSDIAGSSPVISPKRKMDEGRSLDIMRIASIF